MSVVTHRHYCRLIFAKVREICTVDRAIIKIFPLYRLEFQRVISCLLLWFAIIIYCHICLNTPFVFLVAKLLEIIFSVDFFCFDEASVTFVETVQDMLTNFFRIFLAFFKNHESRYINWVDGEVEQPKLVIWWKGLQIVNEPDKMVDTVFVHYSSENAENVIVIVNQNHLHCLSKVSWNNRHDEI